MAKPNWEVGYQLSFVGNGDPELQDDYYNTYKEAEDRAKEVLQEFDCEKEFGECSVEIIENRAIASVKQVETKPKFVVEKL